MQAQPPKLSIIDISGRLVLNSTIQLQKGNTTINKNIPAVASGIYFIRVSTSTENVVRKTISSN